eukprot:TRINITY_DN63353_c0_g1_i1.p1 TRINITY_DN63353_c0_g1~~TRINITY_DN63353_c0_g1_i1.p1  ORF type:complete len:522 (+),score=71.86 TRINITY_DN63353_c0_g1_i1:76-1641(+)
MPLKRPQPLSDDCFPQQQLGATNNGVPLPVKNTFIDVPSGLTPQNMLSSKKLLTAPAELNQPPGFLKRALVAPLHTPGTSLAPVPPSPLPSSHYRIPGSTPMATPSPSAYPHVVNPGSTVVYSGFHAALKAGASIPSGLPVGATQPAVFTSLPAQQGVLGSSQFPSGPLTTGTLGPGGLVTHQSPRASAMPSSLLYSHAPQQYQRPAAMSAAKVDPSNNLEEGDDEEDDDSDGEAVPVHLRNPADAPQPPPGAEHPSLGSEGHATGTCKRCCFFPRGRCTNGYNCDFCHYEHEKRKRKNKKKKKKGAGEAGAAGAVLDDRSLAPATTYVGAPVTYQSHMTAPAAHAQGLYAPTAMYTGQHGMQPNGMVLQHHGTYAAQPAPTVPLPQYTSHAPPHQMPWDAGVAHAQPHLPIAPPQFHHQHSVTQPHMQQAQVPHFSMAPPATMAGLPPQQVQPAHAPAIHQVSQPHIYDPTPPPPLQSPKAPVARQCVPVYTGGARPLPPPPMSSPKLPMNIQQTLLAST